VKRGGPPVEKLNVEARELEERTASNAAKILEA
jgi:hypothetical protein